jgi:hypothetical protein
VVPAAASCRVGVSIYLISWLMRLAKKMRKIMEGNGYLRLTSS